MAQSDKNINYKRKWRDAEGEITKLKRMNNTLFRAIEVATEQFGLLLVVRSDVILARHTSMANEQDSMQTVLEADMVSLQTELDGLTGDKTAAEALIDDVEADAATYNGTHAARLQDLIDAQADVVDVAIIAWFGGLTFRSGYPR